MFKSLITILLTLISFCAAAGSKSDVAQELFWRNTDTQFTEQQHRKYLRELIQQLKAKSRELLEQVKSDATAEEIEELKSIYSNSTIFEDHIEHGVDNIFSAELLQGYLDRFSYDELLAFKKFFNSESYKELIAFEKDLSKTINKQIDEGNAKLNSYLNAEMSKISRIMDAITTRRSERFNAKLNDSFSSLDCTDAEGQIKLNASRKPHYLILESAFSNDRCASKLKWSLKHSSQTTIDNITVLHGKTEDINKVKSISDTNKVIIEKAVSHTIKASQGHIKANFAEASLQAFSTTLSSMCGFNIQLSASKDKQLTFVSNKSARQYDFCLGAAVIFAAHNIELTISDGVITERIQ